MFVLVSPALMHENPQVRSETINPVV